MGKSIEFNATNFDQEVLNAETPVLVDFWAAWCGPCIKLGPAIEELAGDFDGKVKVGKVNVEENQQLAVKYGIRSIPALLVFKGGKVVDSLVGAWPKAHIAEKLQATL